MEKQNVIKKTISNGKKEIIVKVLSSENKKKPKERNSKIELPEKAQHTIRSIGSYTKKLRELIRKKETFEVVCSSNYAFFRTKKGIDYKYYRAGNDIKFMGLLSKVKKDITNNLKNPNIMKNLPNYSHLNIRYYSFGREILDLSQDLNEKNKKININGVHEYDCTKAYIESAYVLGYLSENMYKELVDSDKSMRLRILGAIATQKDKFVFKEGKEVFNEPVKNETMRRVWFHICKYLDNCMWQFKKALGDDFLFYWVDGIVFKKSGLKKAESFAMFAHVKYKLSFHDVKIQNARVELLKKDSKSGTGKCFIMKKEKKEKRFMLPVGKQRAEKRLDTELRKQGIDLTSFTVFGKEEPLEFLNRINYNKYRNQSFINTPKENNIEHTENK